ncbi:MAG: hypothetical protein OXN26_08035 [Gammaproteobacteria bacterium]|nr:hypothetical protein [Gammaproteobacteria bacterium]
MEAITRTRRDVRYEPDDRPPLLLTAGLGLQYALLSIASIVIIPTIIISSAGGSDAYLAWAVFAALVVSGIATIVQVVRIGRIGAGYILVMGSTGAFLAISISALEHGGPGLLASLIVMSSLVQFVLAAKMSLLRRIFTPTVAGTVLMLIPVTVAPMVIRKLYDVPEGASAATAPVVAGLTLLVTIVIALRSTGIWRLWAPAIGIIVGTLTASLVFDIYDTRSILDAPWIGLPGKTYLGIDLSFGPEFWALLPAFVMVTLVGAMDTLGDSIAIQRVSWRKQRPTDFRSIQGAINADGFGSLLSGVAGTVPNTTYGVSVSIAELTGVAARAVGICVGLIFILLAFLPKLVTAIIAIPGPVAAAYLIVVFALIFVFGMEILLHDGLDYRKSLVVGISFWMGTAFQLDWVFPEYFQGAWSDLLANGMTVGGFTVMLLTLFSEAAGSRRRRIKISLNPGAHAKLDSFLSEFAARRKWNEDMTMRVRAAGEETLNVLVGQAVDKEPQQERRLLVIAHDDGGAADLEFIASTDETNLEDQMVALGDWSAGGSIEEMPLRLLRHYAASVRHHQYHDTDVVTVRVEAAPNG